jgi:hypothetical protein
MVLNNQELVYFICNYINNRFLSIFSIILIYILREGYTLLHLEHLFTDFKLIIVQLLYNVNVFSSTTNFKSFYIIIPLVPF